jgi:hypothetical protein
LIRVQSFEPLHANACLFGSRFAFAETAIFSAERCSKNAGGTQIVLWITACEYRIPTFHNPIQNRAALGRFFLQIKVRQPIGRQDSMQTMIETSRRLDSFLHVAAQNFEVFFTNVQE